MKNIGTQFCLGMWAAMAVAIGIESRSWESFFSLMTVCGFFAAGFAASAALRSKRQSVRVAGVVVNLAFYGVILGGLLAGMERVYLVNGSDYPAWMASADIGLINGSDRLLSSLDAATPKCKGRGAEIYDKAHGLVVIRCGGMMWYDSHTYLAHVEGKR